MEDSTQTNTMRHFSSPSGEAEKEKTAAQVKKGEVKTLKKKLSAHKQKGEVKFVLPGCSDFTNDRLQGRRGPAYLLRARPCARMPLPGQTCFIRLLADRLMPCSSMLE
jgi:hypothetical protein